MMASNVFSIRGGSPRYHLLRCVVKKTDCDADESQIVLCE